MGLRFLHVVRHPHFFDHLIEGGLCLSFVIIFFWDPPPAAWLFLVVVAALSYFRLEITIALLPLSFPYFQHLLPLSASGFPALTLAEIGLLLCLCVVVLRHLFRPAERQATREWLDRLWNQIHPFFFPALLLLLGASLALLVSPDLSESLHAYRQEVIEPLLYFLLILRYLRTPIDLARAIGALILSALVVSSLGISQGILHLTSFMDALDPTKLRIGGPTPGPNNLGFLLDRTVPILIALAFLVVRRYTADRSIPQQPVWRDPWRWVCFALLLPLVWALYWTDSRGAEVAILVAVAFLLVVEVRSWRAILVMGGMCIVGIIAFWPRILAWVNEPGHGPASQRLDIWKAALLMIRDHFLLGTGPDSFNTLYQPSAPDSYLLQALNGQPYSAKLAGLTHPHNFILDFWISTGLLGLIAIFWLLGAFAAVVMRAYRYSSMLSHGRLLQRLLLGLAGAMLASVAHGLVDNFYFLPDLALTFWLFMGVLLALRTIMQQEYAALYARAKQQGRDGEESQA